MAVHTVELTVKAELCSSCGICKNICPKGCISWENRYGKYQPVINQEKCVRCGICAKNCPGLGMNYPSDSEPLNAVYGTVLETYNAWSINPDLRHTSASGGVVTSLIKSLLKNNIYDVAFCINTYTYDKQLQTEPVYMADLSESWKQSSIPKSRYLPVSHEKAVAYIKEHRTKRVIFVGTSCAIRGLQKVIDYLRLNRKQYLLIGLFCDRVFNYNVYRYFSDTFSGEKKLTALHFKNKESGGWPGNMKLLFADGSCSYLDKNERGKVKDYFMPERCLYCVDKLNVEADISLGDNYTKQNYSALGSNSVIIRTKRGQDAWNIAKSQLEFCPVEMESIRKAQYLDGRLNNLYYANLKEKQISKKYGEVVRLNEGINLIDQSSDYEQAWKQNLKMIHAGEIYKEKPKELGYQMEKVKRRKNPKNFSVLCERIYYAIKRRIK